MNYKAPKTSREQASYLAKEKRVVYNIITLEEATKYLTYNNYINVITPFKHHTARLKSGSYYECEKNENGKHYYDSDTEFWEYAQYYEDERNKYSEYYRAICVFELALKTLVANSFLLVYKVVSTEQAINAFNILSNRVDKLDFKTMSNDEDTNYRKSKMKKNYKWLNKQLNDRITEDGKFIKATNIYVLLDRISLNILENIYRCLKPIEQKKIFNELNEVGLNLGAKDHKELADRLFNLVPIRNAIMHSNSLEILLKFRDYKSQIIRENNSRKNYENILLALNYVSKKYETVPLQEKTQDNI